VSLKEQSHEIFDLWVFLSYCIPGSSDSWAKAVSNIDSYSWSYSTTKIDSAQCYLTQSRLCLNFNVLPCSKQDHLWPFCYAVALMASAKTETWVFRAMQHWAEFLQHFFHDPVLCSAEWSRLCYIAQSHLHLWLSLWIRKHLQNYITH
jgi:hypothetical protein